MTTSFERDLPEKYLFSEVFVVYSDNGVGPFLFHETQKEKLS
jgi:hypothetical protein